MSCHLWALNLEICSDHNQSSPSWQWHSPRILIISHWKYHKYIYIYIRSNLCTSLYLTKRLTSTVKVVKHSETTSEILTTYIWWPKIIPYSPPKKQTKKKHNTRQSIVYLNFKPTRFLFQPTNQPTNQPTATSSTKKIHKQKKNGDPENPPTTSPRHQPPTNAVEICPGSDPTLAGSSLNMMPSGLGFFSEKKTVAWPIER